MHGVHVPELVLRELAGEEIPPQGRSGRNREADEREKSVEHNALREANVVLSLSNTYAARISFASPLVPPSTAG